MGAEEDKAITYIRTHDTAPDWGMKGKTVLFTGASRGKGRFAANELARLGAEIEESGRLPARLRPCRAKRIDDAAEAWAAPFLHNR
jgi:NAD(P)-dependent dehydrogenase (short-subunit alcohol dehydrogenase family)